MSRGRKVLAKGYIIMVREQDCKGVSVQNGQTEAERRWGMGNEHDRFWVSFLGDKNVLKLIVAMVVQLCEWVN
jgi:hypothetical protein